MASDAEEAMAGCFILSILLAIAGGGTLIFLYVILRMIKVVLLT